MKQIILFFTALSISIGLYSQIINPSSDQNYIRTRTYTEANGSKFLDKINYFDGLGRPIQEIQRGINPEGKDLILIQEYDAYGRESKSWLPMNSGRNDAGIRPKNEVEYLFKNVYYNDSAYSRPIYENSPLNRVIEQYGPGKAWYANKKSVKTEYITNTKDNVSLFKIKNSGLTVELASKSFYAAGELFGIKTTDEDGNIAYEFKDKLGQVVLTRQINNSENYDTYYVYDDYGNLCYVMPPICTDNMLKTWAQRGPHIETWGYVYKYDERNRCIMKKLPGCAREYFIYDKADRVIFRQDGELKKKGLWAFNIPDAMGRTVLTGVCKTVNKSPIITGRFDEWIIQADFNKNVKGLYNSNYEFKVGKTRSSFSAISMEEGIMHTINYYDNYDFITTAEFKNVATIKFPSINRLWGMTFDAESGFPDYYRGSAKGLLTGTRTACINGSGQVSVELASSLFYDIRGQLVQSRSTNHLGGLDILRFAYNFSGKPLQKQIMHVYFVLSNKEETRELYKYTYDHAQRLIETTHKINNNPEISLTKNTYDEFGRLKTSIANNQANLKTSYDYNIRSWITSIKGKLFTENLYYEQRVSGYDNSKSKAYYNGNISVMEWHSKKDGTLSEQKTRAYWLYYDNLSQLTWTSYRENLPTGDHVENNRYQATYNYDKHGNIKSLMKRGHTAKDGFGEIDKLTVTASIGNQILAVEDKGLASMASTTYDFKDRNTEGNDYAYNDNGAMIMDLNKGIKKLEYNVYNQPQRMEIIHTQAEAINEYTYSATGEKKSVMTRWNPVYSPNPLKGTQVQEKNLTKSKQTDYIGNLIYENGVIDKILIEGGYMMGEKYYFYLKDHLGNNRIVADASANLIQRTNYYPFGMPFESTGQEEQTYKFGAKEFDTMHGLNQYDFEARQQDPSLGGRFTSIDPLVEKYYSKSPYVYCGNNPIRRTDLDGKDWTDKVVGVVVGVVTNIVPGTTSLRNLPSPNDSYDYNNALRITDAIAMTAGGISTAAGIAEIAAGGTAAAVGAGVSATGVGAPVGASTAAIGGGIAATGAGKVAIGTTLLGNSLINSSAGYNYGANSSETNSGRGSNHLKPSSEATGAHSSFRRGANGKITNTATYKPNPKNPTGFDEVKRVDKIGTPHKNKAGEIINTPHVHDRELKDVRPARPGEIPN